VTDSRSKRKFAGAPASERRKSGTDAIIDVRKVPPHKIPREYSFIAVTTVTTVTRRACSFKTRGQMEQAKIDMCKKGRDPYFYAWGDSRSKQVRIEFEEIPNA
jgi:hypothetical protein